MKSLPIKIYLPIINFKNRYPKMFTVVVVTFILILFGIVFYSKSRKLTEDEVIVNTLNSEVVPEYFEGKVSYVGGSGENIFYSLTDANGKDIVLLKSIDSKLKIVEGLYVKVYGTLIKGRDNKKDTLVVKEVVLQNGSN